MPYKSREDERESQKRKIAKRKQFNAELKAGIPCAHCGGTFPPICMDWHHRDPTTKSRKRLFNMGKAAFLAEIAKCDLLCANCHRIHHNQEAS